MFQSCKFDIYTNLNELIIFFFFSAILYTLTKQALNMKAFKLARQILISLQKLRIPPKYQVNFNYFKSSINYNFHIDFRII